MRVRFWLGILFLAATVATGCKLNHVPPATRLMHPGPGVDGPGPGVLPPPYIPDFTAMQAPPVQVLFARPEGMQVRWDVSAINQFDSVPLIVPGRSDFPMGGVYRLKLTNIERRVGVELYPTLEVAPVTPRSAAYLEHNAIPIEFTSEDFDQVLSGNFVTKVIYLPDPEFQELALAGVGTLVSTRLDPGVDPIVEADRRGAILAIVRIGNKDFETTPFIDGGDMGGGQSVVVPAGLETGDDGGPGLDLGAADGSQGEAMPVQYNDPVHYGPYGHYPGGASGYAMGAAPMQIAAGNTVVPRYISGVTSPPWGMTTSGTPIGLPGPPHIPHGIPAGLKKHTIKNWTPHFLPAPTKHVHVGVKQSPGYSYPRPANHMFVHERTRHMMPLFNRPIYDKHQFIQDGSGAAYGPGAGGYCPDCQ